MKDTRLALVIQNCPAGEFESNLDGCVRHIKAAAERNADIVVFPEMNLTGYDTGKNVQKIARPLDQMLRSYLIEKAHQFQVTILCGLARRDDENRIFASHLIITPDGGFDFYDKVHTAPFEKKYYTQGNRADVYAAPTLKLGIQLCYDAHFPSLTTVMAKKGAEAVCLPHASPRGTSREKLESWLRHLTARAFDNGLFIAACNQAGDNRNGLFFPGVAVVIGPDGKVIDKMLSDSGEGIMVTRIDAEQFVRIRNHQMRYFLPNRREDLYSC